MLSAPETYGLSPRETLGHTADLTPPEDFDAFWADFRDEVGECSPNFLGSTDDEVNTLTFTSIRSVRVVGRLTLPQSSLRGVVIALHGYDGVPDSFEETPEPWIEFGLATLRLRVRGYPPSVQDTADLRNDWIMRHLESPEAWIVRGAVADVVHATRCMWIRFGSNVPIGIYGESLGGGLAVIAAAQLRRMEVPLHRMVIGMPTFGDWRWRSEHYCAGSGGQVNLILSTYRNDAEVLIERLRLFDAAIHAAAVDCPVLCRLALNDDVVPAPTAAAVYNAVGSYRKWRYLVKYGHFDGGVADARRHVLFERQHPAFLDPALQPEEVIADLELEGNLLKEV